MIVANSLLLDINIIAHKIAFVKPFGTKFEKNILLFALDKHSETWYNIFDRR